MVKGGGLQIRQERLQVTTRSRCAGLTSSCLMTSECKDGKQRHTADAASAPTAMTAIAGLFSVVPYVNRMPVSATAPVVWFRVHIAARPLSSIWSVVAIYTSRDQILRMYVGWKHVVSMFHPECLVSKQEHCPNAWNASGQSLGQGPEAVTKIAGRSVLNGSRRPRNGRERIR